MKHDNSRALFAYWNGVRGSRIAPKRFDIEPGRLGAALADTFILERNSDGTLVFRLAGTRLCEAFATDLRGRDFLEGIVDGDRAKLNAHLECVVTHGAVLAYTLELANSVATKATVEVLVLPLTHTRDTIERFLGCIVWLDAPLALKEHKLASSRLLASQLIWPNGPFEASVAPLPPHLDPARQAPFLPHVRNARIVRQDRRQFRVYDGGLTKPPLDKH